MSLNDYGQAVVVAVAGAPADLQRARGDAGAGQLHEPPGGSVLRASHRDEGASPRIAERKRVGAWSRWERDDERDNRLTAVLRNGGAVDRGAGDRMSVGIECEQAGAERAARIHARRGDNQRGEELRVSMPQETAHEPAGARGPYRGGTGHRVAGPGEVRGARQCDERDVMRHHVAGDVQRGLP